MSETMIIFGGTGRVGAPVARLLLSEGYTVRVFTRNQRVAERKLGAGFEFVQGDVTDYAAVERAMNGCTRTHISLDGRGDWESERRGVAHITEAAARTRLTYMTLNSGSTVGEDNAWFPMIRTKLDAEKAVRASGVAFTIFRCSMFMETLMAFVRDGKAIIMGKQPNAFHWVAASDYAAIVRQAHQTGQAIGETLYVYGPKSFTIPQALETYVATCAPDAKLTKVPFWMLGAISLLPGQLPLRRIALPMMKYFAKVQEREDVKKPDALLGMPGTTLTQWCYALQGQTFTFMPASR